FSRDWSSDVCSSDLALLDVTYLSWKSVKEPEQILAHYHLAPSFARLEILSDPTGQLERLHRAVAPAYADRHWVWKRVLHARENRSEERRVGKESRTA